jgi:hypothetical protein
MPKELKSKVRIKYYLNEFISLMNSRPGYYYAETARFGHLAPLEKINDIYRDRKVLPYPETILFYQPNGYLPLSQTSLNNKGASNGSYHNSQRAYEYHTQITPTINPDF